MNARALAVTEFCSAHVDVWAPSTEPASDYLTIVWADRLQPVVGKLFFYTKQGWYVAPLGEMQLQPSVSTLRTARFTNQHDAFRSERYAVHFPSNVAVDDVIFTSSDGNICPAEETLKPGGAVRYGWLPFSDELTHAPYTIAASLVAAPGDTNCDRPFKPAVVTAAVAPDLPDIVREEGVDRSTTLVEVAVGADGSLKDAWIFSSSGFPQFDEATLRAARLSRYEPERSFCRAAPGTYLFRGVFNVNGGVL